MDWVVYILQCSDKSLYTGITNDLTNRLEAHTSGKGAKYTKGRGPFTLLYQENLSTRSDALKRELEIKKMDRALKLQLCKP